MASKNAKKNKISVQEAPKQIEEDVIDDDLDISEDEEGLLIN